MILGPAIIGGILTVLEGYGTISYRVAIGSLALLLALGLFLLLRLPDARPDRKVDEFAPEEASGVRKAGSAGPA